MKNLFLLLLLIISCQSYGQCPLDANVTKTAQRSSTNANAMSSTAVAWASSGYWWEWQAEVNGEMYFTPQGGSLTTVATGSSFGWLSGTGSANGIRWSVTRDLESRGNGGYYTRGWGIFVAPYCGAGGTIPATNSPTQNIQRPARPDYQTTPHQGAIMFLGDTNSATQSYRNSAVLVPGSSNGATGSPTWELLQSGAKPSYAVLSAATSSSATVRAVSYSDGCGVYNVQVRTHYDGFYSEPMYVFINRPNDMVYRYWEDQNDALGGGYISYKTYETWTRCSSILMDAYGFNNAPDGSSASFSNWPSIPTVTGVASLSRLNLVIPSPPTNTCGSGSDPCSPAPMNPQNPLGNTEAQNRFENWYIGNGLISGSGVPVQNNLSRRYRDHAAHTNFTTPLLTD